MSDGGVSAGQVHNMIAQAVRPLESQVNRLTSDVNALSATVEEMEAELRGIGSAINGMTHTLANKLDAVSGGQRQLLDAQRSTHAMTQEQFVAANTQLSGLHQTSAHGFTSVAGGLDHVASDVRLVEGGVQRMTMAMTQMEVIRIMNQAKGPIDRLKSFSEEIEERFGKALENVYAVRAQYDQLLATAMTEYGRKLHTIGEHIYAIYEHDFVPQAELPLTAPARVFVALPMDVDERKLAAREEALEGNLLEAAQATLVPLLATQRTLEHAMASRYATGAGAPLGDVFVPLDVRLYDDATERPPEVIAGARVEKSAPTGSEGTSTYFAIVDGPEGLRRDLAPHGARIARGCATRGVTADERAGLLAALEELAATGQIDAELMQGYADYLDEYGLEVSEHGGAR